MVYICREMLACPLGGLPLPEKGDPQHYIGHERCDADTLWAQPACKSTRQA